MGPRGGFRGNSAPCARARPQGGGGSSPRGFVPFLPESHKWVQGTVGAISAICHIPGTFGHLGTSGTFRSPEAAPQMSPSVPKCQVPKFPKIKIAETTQSPYMVKSLFLSWMFLILLLENCVLFQYTDHYINNTMIKLL